MRWFGISSCDPEDRIETPIGQLCGHCGEQIAVSDQGVTMPDASVGRDLPYHMACHTRMIVGSVAHQTGRCSCYGGDESDPPGMTVRQAAEAAFALFLRREGQLR